MRTRCAEALDGAVEEKLAEQVGRYKVLKSESRTRC
jgi:hypothetical protein